MSEKEEEVKKKNEEDDNNLQELLSSIRPALITEMLFGIFRFRTQNKTLTTPDAKMKLIGILITSGYVALFAMFLKLANAITGTIKVMDAIEDLPSVVILIQYVASAVTTAFAFSETNIKIILAFRDLDTALHLNITKGYYTAARKHTILLLIILFIIHILFSTGDLLFSTTITSSTVIVFPIYFVQDLGVMYFFKMISMVKQRLDVVNDYLKKYIRAKDDKESAVFSVSNQVQKNDTVYIVNNIRMKIKDLANTYDIIGETCSWINEVFNFQIFMTLVSTFTYVVITIWTSLYYFRNQADNADLTAESLVNIIIWCIRCIFTVAVMCFACERLLLVRNDTKILVNEVIMNYNLPKPIRLQAKAFMELIDAWPLRVFVYDMFSVDITLMLKFISVATTYLIVIIQISHFI